MRVLAGAAGLVLLAIGVAALVEPGRVALPFALFPGGPAGYSSLRGDFGGLFLGTGLFALGGALRRDVRWLAVPAVFLACIIVGRAVSLAFDGPSADAERMMTVELIMLAVLAGTMATMQSVETPYPGGARAWPRVAAAVVAVVVIGLAVVSTEERRIGLLMIQRATAGGLANQSWLDALPDGLHAGLCGSGSPLADPNRAGPCVFIVAGKHLYIVDAGEGSPRKMTLMGLQPARIDAVFITHFHSDHIGGLGELLLERWAGGNHTEPTPVFGPVGIDAVVDGFGAAYRLDTGYRIAHHGPAVVPPSGAGALPRPFTFAEGARGEVVLQQDGLTVTAFPVNHAPVAPAVGYRFDYGDRSVVVSGDTAPSDVLEQQAHGVDLLLHEGLQTTMVSMIGEALTNAGRTGAAKIMHDIPSYHTTPEDAARIAERAGVRHLVFYHTIPPLRSAFLTATFLGDAPSLYHGPITVSKDGTLLVMPSHSTTIAVRELL